MLEEVCPHGILNCSPSFLRRDYILNKTQQADDLYAELLDVADEHETLPQPESTLPVTISKRSVPFGFIGSISRTLFGTLSTEDGEYYNQEIDKLYENQGKMSHLIEKQTHIVQSKLSKIETKIQTYQQINEANFIQTQLLSRQFRGISDKIDLLNYTIMISSWFNTVEAALDTHIEVYKTTLDIINEARNGRLHPGLLSKTQLQQIHQHINDVSRGYELPIPKTHIHSQKLSEISTIHLGHLNRRLIIEIHVPLLETRTYELYKMHPLPIPQRLTNDKTASAYIIPRTKYIAISEDRVSHTFIEENQLTSCSKTDFHQICTHYSPIFEKDTCEKILLIQPNEEILSLCDIRYSDDHKPHWIRILTIDGWLFSLNKPTTLEIFCPGEKSDIVPISSIGIIQLRPRCSARFEHTTLTGIQSIDRTTNYFYLPRISLNISSVAPAFVKTMQTNIPPVRPLIKPINPAITGWPTIDDAESIHSLESELKEL